MKIWPDGEQSWGQHTKLQASGLSPLGGMKVNPGSNTGAKMIKFPRAHSQLAHMVLMGSYNTITHTNTPSKNAGMASIPKTQFTYPFGLNGNPMNKPAMVPNRKNHATITSIFCRMSHLIFIYAFYPPPI